MAEPEFVPKPGQVDYTNIRYCPVINCVVRYGDEILLQQRDSGMRLYPGHWNGVSGFLDTDEDIEEKVYEELKEEVGILREQVKTIKIGQVLVQEAVDYGKTWIVFPILVNVANKETTLNWEVARVEWCDPATIRDRQLLPGFENVLDTFSDDIMK